MLSDYEERGILAFVVALMTLLLTYGVSAINKWRKAKAERLAIEQRMKDEADKKKAEISIAEDKAIETGWKYWLRKLEKQCAEQAGEIRNLRDEVEECHHDKSKLILRIKVLEIRLGIDDDSDQEGTDLEEDKEEIPPTLPIPKEKLE